MCPCSWLPTLVGLSSCGGDFSKYVEVLYEHYQRDFVHSEPTYPHRRWARKRHPVVDGKEATFWHLISEGDQESERLPDLRRCERICWPRPMIDGILGGNVRCWRNTRKGHERVLIATSDFSYVVVLEDRPRQGLIMLWTAYHVEQPQRRRRLQREYAAYRQSSGVWAG